MISGCRPGCTMFQHLMREFAVSASCVLFARTGQDYTRVVGFAQARIFWLSNLMRYH